VRPGKLDDSVINEMLVGVTISVEEETNEGSIGTDANGCSGDCSGAKVGGDVDPGIVLIQSNDDGDSLGRKKYVSNDTLTSCSAIDWTEGKAGELNIRKRSSTRMPMVVDQAVGQTTKLV
jgi:hypothetical protein